jgi:hypothetical protein
MELGWLEEKWRSGRAELLLIYGVGGLVRLGFCVNEIRIEMMYSTLLPTRLRGVFSSKGLAMSCTSLLETNS